jgi:hypothetical protein
VTLSFLNPAGGLRYHLRGYRHAEGLWAPFRFALAEWLYDWEPPEKKLVIVGPSAAWCIQPFFFERFEEVLCLEPDPLARFLFPRRLARAPLEARPRLRFDAEDRLLDRPEALPELLEREGAAALLFSNVLGQLRVLLEVSDERDPKLARVRAAVKRAIAGRSWASFHDRVSGELEPILEGSLWADARLGDAELLERCYGETEAPSGEHRASDERALLDHLTGGFFPERAPHAYFTWPLVPGSYHLIEATKQRLGDPDGDE